MRFKILTAVVVLMEIFSLIFNMQIRDFHDLHGKRQYSLFILLGQSSFLLLSLATEVFHSANAVVCNKFPYSAVDGRRSVCLSIDNQGAGWALPRPLLYIHFIFSK
jgi:hypothetical protein